MIPRPRRHLAPQVGPQRAQGPRVYLRFQMKKAESLWISGCTINAQRVGIALLQAILYREESWSKLITRVVFQENT